MSSAAATAPESPRQLFPPGRMFVNRPFDFLAIGGGLSLLVVATLAISGQLQPLASAGLAIPYLVLLSNSAHFGASTVRLYTKPGAFRLWPFLTMVLPLVTIAVLVVALRWPGPIGKNLQALYLTWSPFHYAAQAFGLACMYHYRAGGKLDNGERKLLFATCMLPFLYAFLDAPDAGLQWILPSGALDAWPGLTGAIVTVAQSLMVLTFATPVVLAARLYTVRGRGLPLVSWLIIVTNGIWWLLFTFYDAFVWATVFHGLQYLAIVMIFHVKDQRARRDNQRGAFFHAVTFYGASLGLGYLLFYVWPFAYTSVGFGLAESMLLCAAVVNIHHFIVDRYIWRLRSSANYAVVTGRTRAASAEQ